MGYVYSKLCLKTDRQTYNGALSLLCSGQSGQVSLSWTRCLVCYLLVPYCWEGTETSLVMKVICSCFVWKGLSPLLDNYRFSYIFLFCFVFQDGFPDCPGSASHLFSPWNKVYAGFKLKLLSASQALRSAVHRGTPSQPSSTEALIPSALHIFTVSLAFVLHLYLSCFPHSWFTNLCGFRPTLHTASWTFWAIAAYFTSIYM